MLAGCPRCPEVVLIDRLAQLSDGGGVGGAGREHSRAWIRGALGLDLREQDTGSQCGEQGRVSESRTDGVHVTSWVETTIGGAQSMAAESARDKTAYIFPHASKARGARIRCGAAELPPAGFIAYRRGTSSGV